LKKSSGIFKNYCLIFRFSRENNIYIDPKEDSFNQNLFDLANNNRTALQLLLEYYASDGVKEDGGSGGRGGEIFSSYLHILIKERIPGLSEFLDARCFKT
jgi:hypothetical protein